jgi:hypothetical protein
MQEISYIHLKNFHWGGFGTAFSGFLAPAISRPDHAGFDTTPALG